MKRIFTLFALLVLSLGVASAQNESFKTRCVYLWDVTGSMRSLGVYDDVFNYMIRDIQHKNEGTEILILPFNDAVLADDAVEFVVRGQGDNFTALRPDGTWYLSDATCRAWRELGNTLIAQHTSEYQLNNNNPANYGGYTNIVAAIEYARENCLLDGYITTVVLLTDGNQEYYPYNQKPINGGDDETREYLRQAILKWGLKPDGSINDNWLCYVMAHESISSPLNAGEHGDKVQFVDHDTFTRQVTTLLLTPHDAEITPRDRRFTINFEMPANVDASSFLAAPIFWVQGQAAEGFLTINRRAVFDVTNGTLSIDGLRFSRIADMPEEFTLELAITLENGAELEGGADDMNGVRLVLARDSVVLTVAKDIRPTLEIKLLD